MIITELGFGQIGLQRMGLSCVYSALPDRQPPRDTGLGSVESQFDAESKHMKQVASNSPDDPKLATAYCLTVVVAESATQMQSTIDHLDKELNAIIGLYQHPELWLLPRCVSRSHATRRGLDAVKKWKSRQVLEDDVQLWKVIGQHELRNKIGEFLGLPKMPSCEGKEVAKVGFLHRRRGYTWDIL